MEFAFVAADEDDDEDENRLSGLHLSAASPAPSTPSEAGRAFSKRRRSAIGVPPKP